jgi:hypothetical protein
MRVLHIKYGGREGAAQISDLFYPSFYGAFPSIKYLKGTSAFLHPRERMAYFGIFAPKNSSSPNVIVLRSRILCYARRHQRASACGTLPSKNRRLEVKIPSLIFEGPLF